MSSISEKSELSSSPSLISSRAVKVGVIVACIATILTIGALLLAHYGYLQKGLAYSSEIYHQHVKPGCQHLGVAIQRIATTPLPLWVTLLACTGSGLIGAAAAFGGYLFYHKKTEQTLASIQI